MIDPDSIPFAELLPCHDAAGDLLCVVNADQARALMFDGFEVEDVDEDLLEVTSIRERKA